MALAEAFMRVPAGGGLPSLTGGGVVLSRSSGGSRIKICNQLQIPILDYGPRADCWEYRPPDPIDADDILRPRRITTAGVITEFPTRA
jgi:hypothetical protein